jgi:uncharacterized membrane protein
VLPRATLFVLFLFLLEIVMTSNANKPTSPATIAKKAKKIQPYRCIKGDIDKERLAKLVEKV